MTAGPWGTSSSRPTPIAQEDDPNLYAYLKADPTNKTAQAFLKAVMDGNGAGDPTDTAKLG